MTGGGGQNHESFVSTLNYLKSVGQSGGKQQGSDSPTHLSDKICSFSGTCCKSVGLYLVVSRGQGGCRWVLGVQGKGLRWCTLDVKGDARREILGNRRDGQEEVLSHSLTFTRGQEACTAR